MDKSVWSEFSQKKEFEQLNRDINCDILVIGGGMAGILTAYYLMREGKNVVLVEGAQIGSGITANTTAVITAQHDTPYKDLIKYYGEENAKNYLMANLSAVEEFKQLINREQIDCDFEITPSYMYSKDYNLNDEVKALKKLGYDAELVFETELPYDIRSAVKFNDMAQFHPLKFLYKLAEKLKIYENTFVKKIDGDMAFTDKGNIKFKQAIVASHFPFINTHGWFFIKMHQKRSYVMALQVENKLNGSFIDDKEEGFYFRNYNDLLIVGKGEHRTGCKTKALEQLKDFKDKFYPDAEVKYLWANQDCVTLDDMPYIGRYGNLNNVFVTTGFNLWGMTGSMVGAMILKDIVCGKDNEFAKTFATKRRVLRMQLFANIGAVVVNMLCPTIKRCPHLGCALKYNKREHSWDCSCHGSRFESNGKMINNPATKNAKL